MKNIEYDKWQVLPKDLRNQMGDFLNNIQAAMEALSNYETAEKMESSKLEEYKRKLYDDLTAVELFIPAFVQ
jgi:phosphoglycolate phosphatase-like HAD superfamily hydrolase